MANQGSQFRFNGDGAPSGNAASPRSLVNALGNIGNGGQPDVDTLMSQYAAQNNNDPEALVRAASQALGLGRGCMRRCAPGRIPDVARRGLRLRVQSAAPAANMICEGASAQSARQRSRSARGCWWRRAARAVRDGQHCCCCALRYGGPPRARPAALPG